MEEESASLNGGYPQQQPSSSTNSHSHQILIQPLSAATRHGQVILNRGNLNFQPLSPKAAATTLHSGTANLNRNTVVTGMAVGRIKVWLLSLVFNHCIGTKPPFL